MSFDVASREILARLEAISGARHVIADAPGMEGFLREPRDRFHGCALCVAQPGSTREVAEVLKLCHETATPVVPQGGNTGLVGGQVPLGPGNQIVLSLDRMRRLREIDLASNTMTVEAGMILSYVQEEA
ncbi:MAG: FAD-binding oxidoreductase, partial [Methylocella sp.]